ncbi:hypothetical protein YC2023_117897 [Brassica napus]
MCDHSHQIVNRATNFMSKGMQWKRKRQRNNIARAVTPDIEKTMSTAITVSFQSGGGDKACNQLDKPVN